jgi:hypothetical protein
MNLPVWLVAFLFRRNMRRNESMQRFTAHAASEGSLRETKYHYDLAMCTAGKLGFDMPNLKALGVYFESIN